MVRKSLYNYGIYVILLALVLLKPSFTYAFTYGVDFVTVSYPTCILGVVDSGDFYYDNTSFAGYETFRNPTNSLNVLYFYEALDGWYIGYEGVGNYFERSATPITDPSGVYSVATAGETYCTVGVDTATLLLNGETSTSTATTTLTMEEGFKSLIFEIGIGLVLLFIVFLGFVFNSISKKKPWF